MVNITRLPMLSRRLDQFCEHVLSWLNTPQYLHCQKNQGMCLHKMMCMCCS